MRIHEEVEGWYKIEAIKPDGSRRVLADWFPNLITDAGLEYMGDGADWMRYCKVGSGSTTQSVLDTALAARIASSDLQQATASGAQSTEPYYAWRRRTVRFAEGVAAGNLSEVGMGWASEGSLFSRALILDSEGDPTTITVAADEILDVTYEFRFYPKTTDDTGSVILSGNIGGEYNYVMRASAVTSSSTVGGWATDEWGISMGSAGPFKRCTAFSGDIGEITGAPSGSSQYVSFASLGYEAASLERKFVATFGPNDANIAGGIRSFQMKMGVGSFQFRVGLEGTDAPIPKTDQDELSLTFMHSWGRRA
tara:strand:- start:607 stop:1533 length:927 start_codon:yes stop_codon:yes gene_type:complete